MRDRHAPAVSEGMRRHANRWGCLAALPFGAIDFLEGVANQLGAEGLAEALDRVRQAELLFDDGANHRGDDPWLRAHYYCVMVLVRYADDPEPLIAEGRWHGEIIDTPRGENGFGYDPYFPLPQFGKTGAELGEDEKNAISHRGQALRELADKLKRLG